MNGNVGIGTTGPGNLLHVYANAATVTPLIKAQQVNTSGHAIINVDRASNVRIAATSYTLAGADEWYAGIV